MDKVSVYCLLDPLNFRCVYPLSVIISNKRIKYEPVLCYEVFKKWPLLSPSPGRFGQPLPLFHLTIILEPYTLVLGCFPLDIQP